MMCLLGNMASGGAAGATSLLVVYPLDFARTRLAMDVGAGKAREFTGTFDCIMKTAKVSGWGKGGVYNGFIVSCVGIVAYRGAYFGLYDTIADMDQMRHGGFLAKFALGYAVTVTAGLISYPLDTIRRRMMMTSGGECWLELNLSLLEMRSAVHLHYCCTRLLALCRQGLWQVQVFHRLRSPGTLD
jgi:solute carrier family 25 (adenine nucleotide translocator) protein 4/5/6/31